MHASGMVLKHPVPASFSQADFQHLTIQSVKGIGCSIPNVPSKREMSMEGIKN